ncbi:hypothetical protein [Pleurocapsa sp. FMAR1]|uniref:hypothetical protein n=1 Tax=Pleurocapsa sp. FMAR1 TaxID=3040204 RepID=UPI0029C6938E|nr:hypothetical protein [Pleurocapsa sp. FMAR1]
MADSDIAVQNGSNQDQEIWNNLQQAIAKSSGFQSWKQERNVSINENLDVQVRRYLEETLETLAY